MKVIAYDKFGPATEVLNLQDIKIEKPKQKEVVIKLKYSGVNPSDAKARAGNRPGVLKPDYDLIIPHSDGSGVIEDVGIGLDRSLIGKRVWIRNGQWKRPFGTAAEYITIPIENTVEMPNKMTFQEGATMGIPGLTAAQGVFGSGSVKGQILLVSGGNGAVGHLAVQLAKWGGAKVISTGSQSNSHSILNNGADYFFDYSSDNLVSQILEVAPEGVDRVIEVEFGLNLTWLHQVVKPNGSIAVYGSAKEMNPTIPFGLYLFKAIKIDIFLIYILPQKQRELAINFLHSAFEQKALTPKIDSIFKLEDCALAQNRTLESGRNGAVLLEI
ncbi:MAG: NADPH:quinone reductase [Rhodobacteraceae bacterium]|nr:NADPH:quinone reductase [Paracoccaceae bacterium]GIR84781.1 MAG: alcohol dehydrogenase [Rhodobacterales bacterium]